SSPCEKTLKKSRVRIAQQPPDDPIRAELFGIERLEQHAESLAAAQGVMRRSGRGRRLLQRVEHNGRVLRDSYRVIAHAIREERAITPAAEWLVDNFHVVDEQLREIRDDLPPGFYRKLPKLLEGPLAGYPRVYGIAWAFVAHTDSRLDPESLRRFVRAYQREQDRAVTPALRWLDQRLEAQGTTSDDIVRLEHQRQAAMNVTVRNVIMSMSLMSALDWTEFFESVSLVDQVLHVGPNYAAMDFATRDAYRHAVEEIGRGSGQPELDVARLAVARAQAGAGAHDDRQTDPGFYLIGNGRPAFEQMVGYRAPPLRRLLRLYVKAATPGYLGTIAVLSGFMLALPLLTAWVSGVGPAGLLVLALLAIVPASDLAIALLNRSVTALVTPAVLPRLELRDGVPPHLRTMVVVPMLLTDGAEVTEQIDRLEVHYLANPSGDLRFAILS